MAVKITPAGLCSTCEHARRVPTRKGVVYLRCALSEKDPRFARYPRLPRLECSGYEPGVGRADRET